MADADASTTRKITTHHFRLPCRTSPTATDRITNNNSSSSKKPGHPQFICGVSRFSLPTRIGQRHARQMRLNRLAQDHAVLLRYLDLRSLSFSDLAAPGAHDSIGQCSALDGRG
jgi:hypothetical protein